MPMCRTILPRLIALIALVATIGTAQEDQAEAGVSLTLEVQSVHDSLSFTDVWWGETDPHYWISTDDDPRDLLRFVGLDVPQGAEILEATLTVWSFNAAIGDANDYVTVWMEQTDDAGQVASPADAWARMEEGGATLRWPTTNTGRNRPQPSPDLSELLQEIVSRPGWTAGNAVQFFAAAAPEPEHDGRQMHSYYTGSAGATRPILEVRYATRSADAEDRGDGGSLLDAIATDERYATFARALRHTGLDATLEGQGPVSVFAPTEEAFAALDDAVLDALFEDIEALERLVEFHILRDDIIVTQQGRRLRNGALSPLDAVLTTPSGLLASEVGPAGE